MCGISGIVGPGAAGEERWAAETMAHALSHRGPDRTAVLASRDGRAVLGMNTLAVISADEELGPYEDPETGCVIAYNGEVYNYRALARQWGIPLRPNETDAHLVLRAYLQRGLRFVEELDGMFAFALYDPRSRTLLLARDRFGEKPLYYTRRGDRIVFASEVKALAPQARTAPAEWFAIETPLRGDTPYPGISLLEPGTMLRLRAGKSTVDEWRYWSLPESTADVPDSYDEALEQFTGLLKNATAAQTPDLPFALMLSGGLDSAVLAYLMRPDYLVTVRYPGEAQLDEYSLARLVADDLGIELVCVEPDAGQFRDRAADLVHHLDYPVGNASLFSELMLYETVRDLGARVVVGGLGPDELLLGYVRHSVLLDGPETIRRAGLDSYRPMAERFRRQSAGRAFASERYLRMLLRGPDVAPGVRRAVYESFRAAGDLGQALTLSDLEVCFPPLVLASDKLSSAYGLERRSPFLAREFAEFCYHLPLAWKRQGPDRTKVLLRDAARAIGVPEQIWGQVNKLGFASPIPAWLAGPLAPWCDRQLTATAEGDDVPATLRAIAQAGLGTPESKFSRARMHALLLSLWWQGTGAPAAVPATELLTAAG